MSGRQVRRCRSSSIVTILAAVGLMGSTQALAHPGHGAGGPLGEYYVLTVTTSGRGTSVTLEATPQPNSYLAAWTGPDCSGAEATCQLVMDNDHSVGATFELPTEKSVTLSASKAKVLKGRSVTFTAGVVPCA